MFPIGLYIPVLELILFQVNTIKRNNDSWITYKFQFQVYQNSMLRNDTVHSVRPIASKSLLKSRIHSLEITHVYCSVFRVSLNID